MNRGLGVWRWGLGTLSLLLVGCGSKIGSSTAESKPLPEYLATTGTFRVTEIDESGFTVLLPSSFQSSGEEKLEFRRQRVYVPTKLPPMSTWKILDPTSNFPKYLAGDATIEISEEMVEDPEGRYLDFVFRASYQSADAMPLIDRESLTRNPADSVRVETTENTISVSFRTPSSELPVIAVDLEGPLEDQRFIRTIVNRITSESVRQVLPVAKHGFAPFGLNNSFYFGHTFWDMDVWVLPSMLFLQPDAVRQMNQYRLDRAAQAEKNAAEFFKKSNSGMMFPWESSVSGKETVRASSVKEHHISGSVLWGLNLSEKAGISSSSEVGKVASGVSRFFDARSVTGPNGREIKDVMSPDENHIGDNDLYTNLLAQWAMNGRKWEGPAKFRLPKDETSFLTYDDDKLRSYKQAAAVLSIFPLQYPEAEKQARTMMERFEGKVSKNGPAMSDAIHATIWARLGEKQKAYDAWKRSWEPFVKGPQMMFSEKRSSERTYFYTGAAGCLNTVVYGFAGFRFDEKPLEGAVWKKQLKSGWWLSCKPCLPPKWKSLTISPMVIDGQRFSVEITPEKVNIQPSV
ncbi:MAG: glycosyl hydrolase family 65 protein [Armatimonadota bacterium]